MRLLLCRLGGARRWGWHSQRPPARLLLLLRLLWRLLLQLL